MSQQNYVEKTDEYLWTQRGEKVFSRSRDRLGQDLLGVPLLEALLLVLLGLLLVLLLVLLGLLLVLLLVLLGLLMLREASGEVST